MHVNVLSCILKSKLINCYLSPLELSFLHLIMTLVQHNNLEK